VLAFALGAADPPAAYTTTERTLKQNPDVLSREMIAVALDECGRRLIGGLAEMPSAWEPHAPELVAQADKTASPYTNR
jgi:hypothetical protein